MIDVKLRVADWLSWISTQLQTYSEMHMKNPAYNIIRDNNLFPLNIELKPTQDGKNYYLYQLNNFVGQSISIDEKACHLTQGHHISIYEIYQATRKARNEKFGLTCFHYTGYYGAYIVHVYFDRKGRFKGIDVKDKEGNKIIITEDEGSKIQHLATMYTREFITSILEIINQCLKAHNEKIKQCEKKLNAAAQLFINPNRTSQSKRSRRSQRNRNRKAKNLNKAELRKNYLTAINAMISGKRSIICSML